MSIVLNQEDLVNIVTKKVTKQGQINAGYMHRGKLVITYTTDSKLKLQEAPVVLNKRHIVSTTAGLIYSSGSTSIGREHTGKTLHCYIVNAESYNIPKEELRRQS